MTIETVIAKFAAALAQATAIKKSGKTDRAQLRKLGQQAQAAFRECRDLEVLSMPNMAPGKAARLLAPPLSKKKPS